MRRTPRTAATSATSTAPTPVRPRLLLVDPYDAPRVVVSQLLLAGGCEVVATAENYAQGIVAARTHGAEITVVVTELYGGTPLTAEQYLAALRRHTPAQLIVHTSIPPSPAEVRAWRLWGAVVKGEQPAELLAMVRAAHAAASRRTGR